MCCHKSLYRTALCNQGDIYSLLWSRRDTVHHSDTDILADIPRQEFQGHTLYRSIHHNILVDMCNGHPLCHRWRCFHNYMGTYSVDQMLLDMELNNLYLYNLRGRCSCHFVGHKRRGHYTDNSGHSLDPKILPYNLTRSTCPQNHHNIYKSPVVYKYHFDYICLDILQYNNLFLFVTRNLDNRSRTSCFLTLLPALYVSP